MLAFKNIHDEEPDLSNELWKSILEVMKSSLASASTEEGVRITYSKVMINDDEKVKIEVAKLEEESDIFWIGKEVYF